jgi:hypothetical protein
LRLRGGARVRVCVRVRVHRRGCEGWGGEGRVLRDIVLADRGGEPAR